MIPRRRFPDRGGAGVHARRPAKLLYQAGLALQRGREVRRGPGVLQERHRAGLRFGMGRPGPDADSSPRSLPGPDRRLLPFEPTR